MKANRISSVSSLLDDAKSRNVIQRTLQCIYTNPDHLFRILWWLPELRWNLLIYRSAVWAKERLTERSKQDEVSVGLQLLQPPTLCWSFRLGFRPPHSPVFPCKGLCLCLTSLSENTSWLHWHTFIHCSYSLGHLQNALSPGGHSQFGIWMHVSRFTGAVCESLSSHNNDHWWMTDLL